MRITVRSCLVLCTAALSAPLHRGQHGHCRPSSMLRKRSAFAGAHRIRRTAPHGNRAVRRLSQGMRRVQAGSSRRVTSWRSAPFISALAAWAPSRQSAASGWVRVAAFASQRRRLLGPWPVASLRRDRQASAPSIAVAVLVLQCTPRSPELTSVRRAARVCDFERAALFGTQSQRASHWPPCSHLLLMHHCLGGLLLWRVLQVALPVGRRGLRRVRERSRAHRVRHRPQARAAAAQVGLVF